MRRVRFAASAMSVALAAACGREAARHAGPVVRDSAGVQIVQNAVEAASEWSVDASPLFTVGWDAGDPNFTWLQSGRVISDGGALVADYGAKAIYRIDASGSVMASWGRQGEGPGEYERLDAMLVRGDSVLVSDMELRRVTLQSINGDVLGTWPLPGDFLHQVSSLLSDGRLLLIPADAYTFVEEVRQEWVFQTQPVIAADLDDGAVDTLAELPHLKRWSGNRGGTPGAINVKGRANGFADGFAWSRNDQAEVRWYDATGRLLRIARWDEAPVEFNAEWRDRLTRHYEAAISAGTADEARIAARRADYQKSLDLHEGPMPYWDAFHVDHQGNAWLREYSLPGEPSDRWRVIARDGTFIGWIEIPDVAGILDITDDRILAVRLNDMDVSAIAMLRLIKR